MVDQNNKDDLALDQIFAEARSNSPELAPDFLARLAQDMDASIPEPIQPVRSAQDQSISWLPRLFAAASLSGAAVLGVWIGFLSPDLLTDPGAVFAPDTTIAFADFLPAANLGDTDGVNP